MKTAEEIVEENFKGLSDFIRDVELLNWYKRLIVVCIKEYANQSRWISVSDRLPENRSYVLSFSPNYNNIAEFKNGCFFEGLERLHKVTHWQPLPTTPDK